MCAIKRRVFTRRPSAPFPDQGTAPFFRFNARFLFAFYPKIDRVVIGDDRHDAGNFRIRRIADRRLVFVVRPPMERPVFPDKNAAVFIHAVDPNMSELNFEHRDLRTVIFFYIVILYVALAETTGADSRFPDFYRIAARRLHEIRRRILIFRFFRAGTGAHTIVAPGSGRPELTARIPTRSHIFTAIRLQN